MKLFFQKSFTKKITAGLIGVALLTSNVTVNAGFLDDLYDAAGSAVNITPAQVYQTQTMGVVTGGGVVWKTPNKNFVPFYVTPPSLKAGCGGIDFFLGAFGMANKEQFVQFLRNVGQNAAGLAFKVALQAMAPELESKIQDVANYINEWNKYFGNSCAAAQKLMDSGPSEWIYNTVRNATQDANATGRSTDYSSATDRYKTDSATAMAEAPKRYNSGGQIIDAAEINIVWSALQSGDIPLSQTEKELMMALVGTVIYRSDNSSGETLPASVPYTSRIKIQELVGSTNSAASEIKTYRCDTSNECLNPTPSTIYEKPFAAIIFDKATNLRQAIIDRTPPNLDDLKLLTVTTSVPIYKIITMSTMANRPGLSQALIEDYSQMIAWEIASRYIEDMADNLDKMLKSAKESDTNALKQKSLYEVRQMLVSLKDEMRGQRDGIYQQINRVGASITMLDNMNRALYTNLSAQLTSNLRFGR